MKTQIDRKVLEELKLLCQKIVESREGNNIWQLEDHRRGQVVRRVQRDLRNLQISTALVQLDLVAPNEITDKVSSLTIDADTRGLRHLILDHVSDLEQYLSNLDRTRPDIEFIESSVKTLSILIELLDSLECSTY